MVEVPGLQEGSEDKVIPLCSLCRLCSYSLLAEACQCGAQEVNPGNFLDS